MKVLIVFYSARGHMYAMAKAAAEGAREAGGAEVRIVQVPELLSDGELENLGALEVRKQWEEVPAASLEDLEWADGIIFGTPTRFGNMAAQMRMFLDSTRDLWFRGALIGKVGSVMVATASQHGGQESTILSTHITLLHHGMAVVGLPFSFKGQIGAAEVSGSGPYGASTISGSGENRRPSSNELAAARHQGRFVAEMSGKLAR
jgi:NAD(P)H dehydrogenase (quinone)